MRRWISSSADAAGARDAATRAERQAWIDPPKVIEERTTARAAQAAVMDKNLESLLDDALGDFHESG